MKKATRKQLQQQDLNKVDSIDQYHQKEEQWRKDRLILEARISELERVIRDEESLKDFCKKMMDEEKNGESKIE